MTQTIIITKNQDLKIPWKVLQEVDFPVGKFRLSIKKPAIFIVPQKDDEEEKDWLDELLEDPVAAKNFKRRIDIVEKEYREGKLQSAEEVFAEIKKERKMKNKV